MILIKIILWVWVILSSILALSIEMPRKMISFFEKKAQLLQQAVDEGARSLQRCKKAYIDVRYSFKLYNLKEVEKKARQQHPKTGKEFLGAAAELIIQGIGEFQNKSKDTPEWILPGTERKRLRAVLLAMRELEKKIQEL